MAKKTNTNEDLSWVLMSPRVTEKAAIQSSENVYTFNVHTDANKIQIKKAVAQFYQVTPERVNIIVNKPEKILGRNRRGGVKKGFKKALVYLPKGKTIAFA